MRFWTTTYSIQNFYPDQYQITKTSNLLGFAWCYEIIGQEFYSREEAQETLNIILNPTIQIHLHDPNHS